MQIQVKNGEIDYQTNFDAEKSKEANTGKHEKNENTQKKNNL